jgi:hypothetical protein
MALSWRQHGEPDTKRDATDAFTGTDMSVGI